MNTAATTPVDSAPAGEPRHHRRSREEVEALAKNFVAAPGADAMSPARARQRLMLLGGGGIAAVVLLAVIVWPGSEQQAARPAADKSRAAVEAEQWRARFEAERERKRKELQAGNDYMAKMAASEAALLQEMSSRASRLTAVPEDTTPEPVAARQAPANTEPTPKDVAPRRPAQVASAPAATEPPRSQPAAAAQPPAPQPATAAKQEPAAQPATVAAAPSCRLHVSQLSSSGTLTFEDVKKMKGAHLVSGGQVLTPPITLDDGRRVMFQVAPDGCMKWRRAG